MGCQKLIYNPDPAIGASWKIFTSGKEKTLSTSNFCIDYYTGGMIMPGRSGSANSYRYKFNGMECDDEVSGEGNSYTTEYRHYDPRVMRWKSLDPKSNAQESPYVGMGNNPIWFNDPYGDTIRVMGSVKKEDGTYSAYTYRNGKFIDGDGNEYQKGTDDFMDNVTGSIKNIKNGGEEGRRLIGSLSSNVEDVMIIDNDFGDKKHRKGWIKMDFDTKTFLPDENGFSLAPNWLVLAHEFGHAEDYLNGTMDNSVWYDDPTRLPHAISNSEKYATHVENKIRAENNMSLRTHYAHSGGDPIEETRIISNGKSLFYKQTTFTIMNKTSESNDMDQPIIIKNQRRYDYSKDNQETTTINTYGL